MKKPLNVIIICLLLTWMLPVVAHSELKIIETESSYSMGDNDSKIDARRIAVQEAKRKALEMAGTFVESLTEVKNMALTKDEVKAYTAGVVETEIMSEKIKGSAEHPEITVKTKCKIDTAVLLKQLSSFRENEELKDQLETARKENESLKNEREKTISELSAEKDKSKAEKIRKNLDTILAREESADEVNRLWRDFTFKKNNTPQKSAPAKINEKDLNKAEAGVRKIIKADPENLRAHLLLAAIHKRKGDNTGAEKELRTAIKIDPSNFLPHFELGKLLRDEGRFKEAIKEYEILQKLRPHDPRSLFLIGLAYRDDDNCYEAANNLKRFLRATEKSIGPLVKLRARAVRALKECESGPRKRLFDNYQHK